MRRVGKRLFQSKYRFIKEPLCRVMDYIDESEKLSRLYSVGIAGLQRMHQITMAAEKVKEVMGKVSDIEVRDKRLAYEKELGALAKEEIDSGHRLLCAHALVGVWGVIESAIDDWVVEWIMKRPGAIEVKKGEDIKLPASSVIATCPKERAEALFEALFNKRWPSRGVGVERFERPLELIGLSVNIPQYMVDAIYEMHKIRNVYAHCGGRADKMFLSACPWFKLRAGEIVPLNRSMLNGYTCLLTAYVLTLVHRGFARVHVRLVGPNCTSYFDPSIKVIAISQEVLKTHNNSLLKALAALPVIKAKHAGLLLTDKK